MSREHLLSSDKNLNFGWPLTWKVLTELCVESQVPELGTWPLIGQHQPHTRDLMFCKTT
jgi:hypothetical protein